MDALTIAFAALGAGSVGALVLSALMHQRRMRTYRKMLVDYGSKTTEAQRGATR